MSSSINIKCLIGGMMFIMLPIDLGAQEKSLETIADKWTNAKTWDAKERYANQLDDCMFFPVYVKSSYSRENSDSPLTKWKYNIGMTVIGKILD